MNNKYVKDWECHCHKIDMVQVVDLDGNHIADECTKCGRRYFQTEYYMKFMYDKNE